MTVAKGWGRENRELSFNGYSISVEKDVKVLEMMVVMVAQKCQCT